MKTNTITHLSFLIIFLFSGSTQAQPTATPATNYTWQSQGCLNYSDGPYFTGGASGDNSVDCSPSSCGGGCATSCGGNDTSFGWNIQCATTPTTTLGTPGANFLMSQVFGDLGTADNGLVGLAVPCNPGVGGTATGANWPSATSETRRLTLTNWNNLFPDSDVSNGATSGTVWLPKSAKLNFRDDGVGDGTGAGADELRFTVIGGDGGGTSSWEITATYDLKITVSGAYGALADGTKINESIVQQLTNTPDAGAGNNYYLTDNNLHSAGCGSFQSSVNSWYFPGGTNTASFGTGYTECIDVLASLAEDGSTFTVDFESNQNLSLARTGSCDGGGSDGRATMGPGLGGKVELLVEYEVWTIINTLPVELSSFDAAQRSNTVELNWTTLSETNSAYFLVERSEDGKIWTTISTEILTGEDSQIKKDYFYIDNNPNSKNYYRLKQVDVDGRYSYSDIEEVSLKKSPLVVAPNPTQDKIRIDGAGQWSFYQIINRKGQVVLSGNENEENLSELPNGV